jgi:hypothetical protein
MDNVINFDDNCIIVRIPVGICRKSLYEATRRCWRVNLKRAKEAVYLLGTVNGTVLCEIKIESCYHVPHEFCEKEENICKDVFKTNTELCKIKKRVAFEGKEPDEKKYLGKNLPQKYIPGQCPVRYTY